MRQTILKAPVLADSVLQEEIDLELHALQEGVQRYQRLAGEAVLRGDGASLKPAERLLLHWLEPLTHVIKEEQRHCRIGTPGVGRAQAGPVLNMVDAEVLAVLTMHAVVSACMAEPAGTPVNRLAHSIGSAVFAEIHAKELKAEHKLKELEQKYRKINPKRINWWARKNLDDPWTSRVAAVQTGTILIGLLIEWASADSYDNRFTPAFSRENIWRNRKQLAVIRMVDEVYRIIDEGHAARWHMRPRYLPMIVEPYRWSDDAQGGYVKIRTPLVSKPSGTQKRHLADADLSHVYDALHAVGATPWRENRKALEVERSVWETGGGMLGIPHRENRPLIPFPAGYDSAAPQRERWRNVDPEVKRRHKAESAAIRRENVSRKSDRQEFLQRMLIADRFQNHQKFYYPHQLDFRGRVYPIPAHLNHQGDDVCRGLLEFAEGKPTGDLRWLAIHAANCWGFDKVSYDDRKDWTVTNLSRIQRAIADPMGTDWWRKAEKPWQFLAACFAMFDPDAAAHLPIQLDGTCNGLQHYAALGRDERGAAVVNMLPGARPADVYSNVAAVVARLVKADSDPQAAVIRDMIDRKMVKQTVMTSVYGVTMVGARQQIQERLRERGIEGQALYDASRYLSNKVLSGIGEVCSGARAIMDWLRECAEAVTATSRPVRWTTPLGFPVTQPYRKYRTKQVNTRLAELRLIVEDESVPVARKRHADGFAPNFVHSIDATHMMMTAVACREAGITFAGVHDSYWTHAATADDLARITREQFVKLHSQPILANLAAELRELNPEAEIADPPPPGNYDLGNVLKSPYFFS